MKNNKKEKYGYIYKCTYLKNNKIYIGQKTGNKIKENYYGSGSKWQIEVLDICNKTTDIKREILEWCYSADELNNREKYWINYYNATNSEIGYNISLGGHASSIEMRENMSKILHNVMTDENIRKQISNSLKEYRKNNTFTLEHRQKLRENGYKRKGISTNYNKIIYAIFSNKIYKFEYFSSAISWWRSLDNSLYLSNSSLKYKIKNNIEYGKYKINWKIKILN